MSTPLREESSHHLYCRSRNLNESSDSCFVSPSENGNNNSWQTCSHKIIKSNESVPIKTFLKITKSHCTGHLLFANQQPPPPRLLLTTTARCSSGSLGSTLHHVPVSAPLRPPISLRTVMPASHSLQCCRHHARAPGGRGWLFFAVFGQIGRWISQYLQLLRETA